MDIYVIVLRLLHIFGAVLWGGTVIVNTFFLGPTAGATGESGQKFMGYLFGQTRFPKVVTAAAVSTIVAGALLYAQDSAWLSNTGWMNSLTGTVFGIGGLFGLIGFAYGFMVPKLAAAQGQLGAQMKGAPTPEQMAEMGRLQKRYRRVSQISAGGIIVAVILMSIARYLHF